MASGSFWLFLHHHHFYVIIISTSSSFLRHLYIIIMIPTLTWPRQGCRGCQHRAGPYWELWELCAGGHWGRRGPHTAGRSRWRFPGIQRRRSHWSSRWLCCRIQTEKWILNLFFSHCVTLQPLFQRGKGWKTQKGADFPGKSTSPSFTPVCPRSVVSGPSESPNIGFMENKYISLELSPVTRWDREAARNNSWERAGAVENKKKHDFNSYFRVIPISVASLVAKRNLGMIPGIWRRSKNK